MHRQHAQVFSQWWIVVNEAYFSGNRHAVIVYVERAHEYPDEDFRTVYVLPCDVVQSGFHSAFYVDYAFLRHHSPHIDDGAVGRAEDAGSFRRNNAAGIAKKPDMTPKQVNGGENYCADKYDNYWNHCCIAHLWTLSCRM